MGTKVRVGMLCKFQSHHPDTWVCETELPTQRNQKTAVFGKRHVTVVEKRGGRYGNVWRSYSKVLGIDKAGNPLTGWVITKLLKPRQESRKSQSKD